MFWVPLLYLVVVAGLSKINADQSFKKGFPRIPNWPILSCQTQQHAASSSSSQFALPNICYTAVQIFVTQLCNYLCKYLLHNRANICADICYTTVQLFVQIFVTQLCTQIFLVNTCLFSLTPQLSFN